MKWRALALGAAMGFSLAVVPSCGGPQQKPRCMTSNCKGCCDSATGDCQPGTTALACGAGALTCQTCAAGQSCLDGQCRSGGGGGGGGGGGADAGCTPQSCAGCCWNGECKPGNLSSGCGSAGGTCAACQTPEVCRSGVCQVDTCQGCVDAVGTCLPGTTENACGKNGALCSTCLIDQACQDGACVGGACTSQSCPNGCCAGDTCINPPTNAQCGINGASCVSCQGAQTCDQQNGTCVGGGSDGGFDGGFGSCDSSNCAGCCFGGMLCIEPVDQDDLMCGNGGQACQSCVFQLPPKTCNTSVGACQ